MDESTLRKSLRVLELAFGRMAEDAKGLYLEFLAELGDPDIFRQAIGRIVRTRQYKGVPPVAEILAAYDQVQAERYETRLEGLSYWEKMQRFNDRLAGRMPWPKPEAEYLRAPADWSGWGELPADMQEALDGG